MRTLKEFILSDLQKYTDAETGVVTLPLKIHLEATNLSKERIKDVLNSPNWDEATKKLKDEVLEDFYLGDFDFKAREKILCKYLSDDTLFKMSKEEYDLTDILSEINFRYDYTYLYMNLPDNIYRANEGADLSDGVKAVYIGEKY